MPLTIDSQGTVKFSCTTCEGYQYHVVWRRVFLI